MILLEFKENLNKNFKWIFPACCEHVNLRLTYSSVIAKKWLHDLYIYIRALYASISKMLNLNIKLLLGKILYIEKKFKYCVSISKYYGWISSIWISTCNIYFSLCKNNRKLYEIYETFKQIHLKLKKNIGLYRNL